MAQSENQRKKIQGHVFALIWRPHAKIQALLEKKKQFTQIFHFA